MSLTTKEEALVSVGASLAAGCKLCANFHYKEAQKAWGLRIVRTKSRRETARDC